jgi:hypothetical protein
LNRADNRPIIRWLIVRCAAILMTLAAAPAAMAGGSCAPSWSDGRTGGANGNVRALLPVASPAAFTPGLYVGGAFTTVGPISASNVAMWSGHSWMTLTSGTNGEVRAMALHDPDGDGPEIARLIAGGAFTSAGGFAASRIAIWDGAAWSALGTGVNGTVNALASFDADGPGPQHAALYAAGFFSLAGGTPAQHIARWDSAAWSAAGDANNEVVALSILDPDGLGPLPSALHAAGWFTGVGGVNASRAARWDGANWAQLGAGLSGPFPVIGMCITTFGERLIVGGFFRDAGGSAAFGLARWDESTWASVGGGIGFPAEARAAVAFDDDGDGPNPERLFVAGSYLPIVGGPANHIAAWDSASWSTLGTGFDIGAWSVAVFDDDGDGPDPAALYVGGEFSVVDGAPMLHLARWGCPRTTPPPCADANSDGVVNFADITAVLANFGENYSPGTGMGDANGDGVVTFGDITAVLSAWGMGCG